MSAHIPAWKRIALKKQENVENDSSSKPQDSNTQGQSNNSVNDQDDDPFNVTTHLATGSLTKREKKRILNGEDLNETKNKKSKKNADGEKKRKKEKLPKEERLAKQKTVLKDPLRYLIEFYIFKIDSNIETLPKELLELPSVSQNLESLAPKKDSQILSLWKFNKSKQTWLLKNVFQNEYEIPEQYDQLVVQYFKSLKGQSRDQLVEECEKVLQGWNTFIKDQQSEMEKLMTQSTEDAAAKKNEDDKGKKESSKDNKKEEVKVAPSKILIKRALALLKELDSEKVIALENWEEES